MHATRFRKVEAAPYRESVDAVLGSLGTDAQRGLSATEARTRLDQFGPNELTAEKPAPAWKKFIAQFKDVLVILLLTATAVSAALWLVERETALPYEAIAILAVVMLNAIMGYIQESRAESAVAALRKMAAAHATVMRDGTPQSVPASEIVPGDLILVEEGDSIPADARLIHCTALHTSEAALTGESLPVSKYIVPVTGEAELGGRSNMVFSGTAATYGRGKAIVTATGMQTEMGRIAGMLGEAPAEATPLQKELDRLGKRLGTIVVIIAVGMIVTIILVEKVRGFSAFFDVLILGVALAVAAVSEGLPAVVTAVLLPLSATQILWINLVTDGAPALALGVDPPDAGLMNRPPRPRSEGVITRRMWMGIFSVGAIMAAGTLLVLDASLPGGLLEGQGNLRYAQTMAFTTLMLFQLFNVFSARSDVRSARHGLFQNAWLWSAVGFSLALHMTVIYLPFLQNAFSTVSLSWSDWLMCFAVASSVLWLRELRKCITRARAR